MACISHTAGVLLRCIVVVAPFLLLQLWAWFRFCVEGVTRPWCANVPPFVYSFIQKEYWGLGMFAYWRPEQVPNFALAAPVVLLTACGVVCAVRGAAAQQLELASAYRQAKPQELVAEERQVRTVRERARRACK